MLGPIAQSYLKVAFDLYCMSADSCLSVTGFQIVLNCMPVQHSVVCKYFEFIF